MPSPDAERRSYLRHPIRVPLAVRPRDGGPEFLSRIGDISAGGVSFTSPKPLPEGTGVEVELPVSDERFALLGAVASCIGGRDAGTYRIGLCFLQPGMSFRMKLAEQVLRVGRLREELSRSRGMDVSLEEAAQYWVDQYAELFADLYGRN